LPFDAVRNQVPMPERRPAGSRCKGALSSATLNACTLALMGLLSLLFGCGAKESPFQQRDGVWYYNSAAIAEADAKSFQPLTEHYAKDKDRVYYAETYRDGRDYFTTKRNRVWVIERADAATFRYIERGYGRDRANVFFEGVLFPVKDIDTFELLEYAFAKDRISGYYHERPVTGSDGSTFAQLDSHYSKDAKNAFYSDLQPGTGGTGPLRQTVQLKGAKPESLSAFGEGYAADAGQVYFQGRVLSKAVSSFRKLEFGYAKTDAQVYYMGKQITGADAATFVMLDKLTETADAKDRAATYRQGRRN
jgi:hypothetical protein